MDIQSNYLPSIKLKKINNKNYYHDIYCFECHRQGDMISCESCPRVYHSECLGSTKLPEQNWTCPECDVTPMPFNTIDQSISSQNRSINRFNNMLKYTIYRLKSHSQAKHFIRAIDSNQISEHLDNAIHPMDLEIIEKNVNQNKYNSTKAFLSDMKWIVHNSIIYNGNQSKLTRIARTLLKISRHEMTEIEICSECYLRSAQSSSTDWFTTPCTIPHTLCWAKMKTYQPWPAKVLRVVNDEVDVRFFGEHNRAWIPIKNCFVLSKEYPGSERKKSNTTFEKSLTELQRHIDQLNNLYGSFTYAPRHTLLSKTIPFKFVSVIDDSLLPSYMTVVNSCSSIEHSHLSTEKSSSKSTKEKTLKRYNESSNEQQQQPAKRRRITEKNRALKEPIDLQPMLNVFDLFNQSDQTVLPKQEDIELPPNRCCSPTDNKFRIQALLRRYIPNQSPTIDFITLDVRSTMNALLDAVEALKTISEVRTILIEPPRNNPILQQRKSTKKSRKSNLQHRIVQPNPKSNFINCSSLDQSLCPSLPFVPLRSLSVSPPNVDHFQSIPSVVDTQQLETRSSTEILNIKSELIDNEEYQIVQSLISTNSPLLSVPFEADMSLPTIIPNFTMIPQQYIDPLPLITDSSICKSKNTTRRRARSSTQPPIVSNASPHDSAQFHIATNIIPTTVRNYTQRLQHTNQPLLDNRETRHGIQTIINSFTDQFQQLIVNLTSQIESSLETTRLKYEKDLEEIRRSHRLSFNDLHSIATEQVQEIQNSLELQYWKRLSDMRNRYESKLQYQ